LPRGHLPVITKIANKQYNQTVFGSKIAIKEDPVKIKIQRKLLWKLPGILLCYRDFV